MAVEIIDNFANIQEQLIINEYIKNDYSYGFNNTTVPTDLKKQKHTKLQ